MSAVFLILLILIVLWLLAIKPGTRKNKTIDALKKQKLYAHRGLYDNNTDHPENSLKAFQNAVDHHFGIEMDVQLTKDGIPVVFHDFSLKRVTRDEDGKPVEGKVCDYTLAQLRTFHLCQSQEKIPTFQEFLDLVQGQVPVIVELKIENADKELAVCPKADKLLSEYKGLYCIESFNPRGIRWYKQNRPDVIRGQLSSMFNKTNADRKKWWFIYFLSENLMFNFLTKPDFIAYDAVYYQNMARRICRYSFHNMAVAWTIRSEKQLKDRWQDYDLFIFEGFTPEVKLLSK